MCTDIEELYYVIVILSDVDVYALLHGELSMREAIIKQTNYWEVISGEEITTDSVTEKSMEEIDCSILPEKGACFEILTDEVSLYVEKFDAVFWTSKKFELTQQTPDFNENILNELYCHNNERIEQFMELYNYLSEQKVTVGLEDGDAGYTEDMNSVLCESTEILGREPSEEWRVTEMNNLAFAA